MRLRSIAATNRANVSTIAVAKAIAKFIATIIALWSPLGQAGELTVSAAEAEAHRVRLAAAGFDLMIERQLRLTRVDARIRIANAPLCTASLAAVTGIVARTADELPESFRDVAYERHAVGDLVKVLGVVPGFAGAESGVRVGDTILRVNGEETHLAASLDGRLRDPDQPLRLQIERDGAVFDLQLQPGKSIGCHRPAELLALDVVDLYPQRTSTANRVRVGTGMLRFLESDDELAILLAHELAHSLLALEKLQPDARVDETDADELGLYLAARAGFDVSGAVSLLQRLERESPLAVGDRTGYAHPVTARRFEILESTADEIARKRKTGVPLMRTPR